MKTVFLPVTLCPGIGIFKTIPLAFLFCFYIINYNFGEIKK